MADKKTFRMLRSGWVGSGRSRHLRVTGEPVELSDAQARYLLGIEMIALNEGGDQAALSGSMSAPSG